MYVFPGLPSHETLSSPAHWYHHCLLVLCFPLKLICFSDAWIPSAVTTVAFLRCRVQACPFFQCSSMLDQGHKPYTTNELDLGNLSLVPTPYSLHWYNISECSECMLILWHTTKLLKFSLRLNCSSLFGKLLGKLSLVSPFTLQTKSNCKHIQEFKSSHFPIYPHRIKSHSPPEPQQRSKYLMHTQQILTLNFLAGHI